MKALSWNKNGQYVATSIKFIFGRAYKSRRYIHQFNKESSILNMLCYFVARKND